MAYFEAASCMPTISLNSRCPVAVKTYLSSFSVTKTFLAIVICELLRRVPDSVEAGVTRYFLVTLQFDVPPLSPDISPS